MNSHEMETSEVTSGSPETGPTGWQTPEYTVVETSLEVTAYRLADR
ncbi:pyrroloquinoline quinone precursor peptide PqqA [Streptomyces alboflavus]|nr:pyrroloquinoline quinone precursor peptide PqqA [Streptomyces alboflavus]